MRRAMGWSGHGAWAHDGEFGLVWGPSDQRQNSFHATRFHQLNGYNMYRWDFVE